MVVFFVALLWLLAMVAAALHLRDGDRSRRDALRIGGAFAVVLPLALWASPQPNWIGSLLALCGIGRVIIGPMPRGGGLLAGAAAGLGAALLIAAGLSPLLAIPVTAAGLGMAFLLGGKAREGALVLVALALPPAGLANDLVYGWQSASALGEGQAQTTVTAAPLWAVVVVVAALLAGMMKGFWLKP